MNQPDMNEPDIEHRLRDAIETIIGSAPYALCFDDTPLEDMFDIEPATCMRVVQPLRQATYTTRGLFEAGSDILACTPIEGDTE